MRNLLDIPDNQEEKNYFPALDYVFCLDMSHEKILERANSLRLDPSTGIIYDPVLNPAPETDKKLMARLEPVKFDSEALDSQGDQFSEEKEKLQQYLDHFGFQEVGNPVFQILDATQTLAETEKQIIADLKPLIDYKYSIYESDQLPQNLKDLVRLDEASDKGGMDVDALSEKADNAMMSPRADNDNRRQSIVRDSKLLAVSQTNVQDKRGSFRKQPSYRSISMKGSHLKDNSSYRGGGTAKKDRWVNRSLNSWESIFQDYSETLDKIIKSIQERVHILKFQFDSSQRQFAAIFKEKREFFTPIFSFIDSYKRFAADNPEVIKTAYCKQQLAQKIDQIHDKMWAEIEACKKKAMTERDKLITKSLIHSDIQFICKSVLNLVGAELNRLFHLKYASVTQDAALDFLRSPQRGPRGQPVQPRAAQHRDPRG